MLQEFKPFKFLIIIPAYNEVNYIGKCLDSLINQSLLPHKIIVVDDGSTDETPKIIKKFSKKSKLIHTVFSNSKTLHQPGAKVINAFKRGLSTINLEDYDIVCKFDADLEFPSDYLEKLNRLFKKDITIGLFGGVCTILKSNNWQIESLTNSDHVRGALKAYRVKAFQAIYGLQPQMGWDTADEFKLRYRNWKVAVDKSLKVKHHKSTATSYKDEYFKKQGEVFYALRYGFILTLIAALKIASMRNKLSKYKVVLKAYMNASKNKIDFLLTNEEGKFLRQYRWREIYRKIIP
jgi:glycosyltransferase involved in cell wall biosynthesis